MNVLTIYAHPNPKSFCHAVLEQFTKGLAAAGHSNEVVDLYAIINTTIFSEEAYRSGFGDAMTRLMDEWCLHYPGIQPVEHGYFCAVNGASDETRRSYLDRAYLSGRNFTSSSNVAAA